MKSKKKQNNLMAFIINKEPVNRFTTVRLRGPSIDFSTFVKVIINSLKITGNVLQRPALELQFRRFNCQGPKGFADYFGVVNFFVDIIPINSNEVSPPPI